MTWSGFIKDFYHTRQSLEAFESCPLKFYKRYFEGLRWDKLLDAKDKAVIERGNDFHMLARRYFLGIDCGLEEGNKDHAMLSGWLKNLKTAFTLRDDARYLPELKLRFENEYMRLEANFDLVIQYDDKLEIWDWKTHASDTAAMTSKRERLEKSLQTMVYMYTSKERSSAVFGREYDYNDIHMYYWQPEPSEVIASISYSKQLHERYGNKIGQIVNSMEVFDRKAFDSSLYHRHCKYCEFNGYFSNELKCCDTPNP